MRLGDLANSRDNNFNLIRVVAALSVLVSHSFVLSTGLPSDEPWRTSLHMTLGTMAVYVFFVTSGFLVTASLMNRRNIMEFIEARILRIYPALFAMLLVTLILLGLFISDRSFANFVKDPMAQKYFLHCGTLFFGAKFHIAPIFSNNPYKNAINGSLWTLPYEINMYLSLAILWVVTKICKASQLTAFKVVLSIWITLESIKVFWLLFTVGSVYEPASLIFMFHMGAVYYIFRDKIVLKRSIFYVSLLVIALSTINDDAFLLAFHFLFPYVLFYLAHIPKGRIRAYNKIGDYSYGIYIYAFLVQQTVMYFNPSFGPYKLIATSFLITMLLAVTSWHLIEKNCLKYKDRIDYASYFTLFGLRRQRL